MMNLDDSFLVEGTLIAWQEAAFSTVKLLINLWCLVYPDKLRRALNSLWKKEKAVDVANKLPSTVFHLICSPGAYQILKL